MSGKKTDAIAPLEKQPLSHGWIVVPSKTYPDRVYFFNTVTRCSTWTNPCEVQDDKIKNKTDKSKSNKKKKSSVNDIKNDLGLSSKNSDIEDFDEQDKYFENIPFNLSQSNLMSPPSSPESVLSFKTNLSDSDSSTHTVETGKKKLWLQFQSPPNKPVTKKSIALSDLDIPSTSIETVKKSLKLNKNGINNYKKEDIKGKRRKRPMESQKKDIHKQKNMSTKKQNKTPAQSRLLRLRQKNSELLKDYIPKSQGAVFNDQFTRLDKTPAQTRLLRLRHQTSEMIKEASKHTSFKNNDCDNSYRNMDITNSCSDTAEEGVNSGEGFYEEMDWEPSNEELDVKNINVFRKQLDRGTVMSQGVFCGVNSDSSSGLTFSSWVLVLDTNIFVSCLNFVKELRDTMIPGGNYPIIYVPWRVLQELDHLKDSKIAVNKQLHVNVRRAINYLNDNFKVRHPRCVGQSQEEFTKLVGMKDYAPDDEILQTCIQLQKLYPDKKMVLLTNDKNLESKAIVSGIDAYSKERFQKKYLSGEAVATSFNITTNIPPLLPPSQQKELQNDRILCEVKTVLKNFLTFVVETELKIAFEKDWSKLAFRKPPWSLQDALDCLKKHWRSVFFLVFPKQTLNDAEKLYKLLFKREAATSKDICEIIHTIEDFITSIKTSGMSERSYTDLVDFTMSNLKVALKNLSPQVDEGASQLVVNNSLLHLPQSLKDEVNKQDMPDVMSLFSEIWESFRLFCCSVTDRVNSSIAGGNIAVQEMKSKISETLKEIQGLVMILEKILEVSPQEINECHPLINYLSNFLIHLCPMMEPNLSDGLPKSLSAAFSDLRRRSVISNSLTDFRQFFQNLVKATENFDSHAQL